MAKVKFTKIKKRKYYQTWFNKNRNTGLISFIYCDPNGYYHWVITCFLKRCGLDKCILGKCDKGVYYNSLNDGLQYEIFEECVEAVEQWHRNNKKYKMSFQWINFQV
jgi:hypothetical protein